MITGLYHTGILALVRIPYCHRRPPYGVWQLQIRLTGFDGVRRLLRISLRTRCHRAARLVAFNYLSWLLLMQSPTEIDAEIDTLIGVAKSYLEEGPTSDPHAARVRSLFLVEATRMVEGWYATQPSPVKYHNLYRRHREMVDLLNELNHLVSGDLCDSGVEQADPSYFSPPRRQVVVEECDDFPDMINVGYAPLGDNWVNLSGRVLPPDPRAIEQAEAAGAGASAAQMPQAPLDPQPPVASPGISAVAPSAVEPLFSSSPREPTASELLTQAVSMINAVRGDHAAERDIAPYVLFMTHALGDRPLKSYTTQDFHRLCELCGKIPTPGAAQRKDLIARYEYGRQNPHLDLEPISVSTIENRIFSGLRRYFRWCQEHGHWSGDLPKLQRMAKDGTAPLERDSFNDTEVRNLFSQPIFVGHERDSPSDPGPFLRQGYMYWGYILAISTGMRAAEIAQIRLDQIVEGTEGLQGLFFIDLRPYDSSRGRVRVADLQRVKTTSAARVILLHPALMVLGLGERVDALRRLGHVRLFPDCIPYSVNGDLKYGHSISKDWQSRKSRVTQRANVTLHSLRHYAADVLDGIGIPKRDRDRQLGHAGRDVGHVYGRKATLNPNVVDQMLNSKQPLMTWLYDHLQSARDEAVRQNTLLTDWAVPYKGEPTVLEESVP